MNPHNEKDENPDKEKAENEEKAADPIQYKVVDQPWQPSDPATAEAMLNATGAQGWSLDSAYPDRQREKTRWVFTQGAAATPVSYKVVDQAMSPSDPAATQALLTSLGQAGWSLSTVYRDPQRERTRWIFTQGAGGGTAPPTGIPEAPTDGALYGRQNTAWSPVPPPMPGPQGPAGTPGTPGASGPQGAAGPAGPTSVSANAGNLAKLGTDNLLLVPAVLPLPITLQPPTGTPATLKLNKAASGDLAAIQGFTNGSQRWELDLGAAVVESGSNKGSNFTLAAYSDTGALLGNVMSANRATQVVTFPQTIVNGSDTRWKENATSIPTPLATLQSLNGQRFTIAGDPSGITHLGLIAQEVQLVIPDAVIDTGPQALYGVDYDNALGVSYTDITTLLVEAVKQLATPVAFAATASITLAVAKNTPTKINFDTIEFDTTGAYDTTNYRYTPQVAGYYEINCGCGLLAGAAETYTSIYKNGAEYRRSTTSDQANARLSTLVYLNGTTDYIEGYIYSLSNFSTDTGPVLTSFSGSLTGVA